MIPAARSSRVEVLLSTHNGEQHIVKQIASVLTQTHERFSIRVRDDGSSDRTVAIVRELAAANRLHVTEGPRVGSSRSFLTLLAASSPDARFVAFCDQDDVWLPDKLARAVAELEPFDDRPTLYASAMLHVCDRLRPLATTARPRAIDFRNALVQNVLPGCTMVLNRAAKSLCLERLPTAVPMHDWWLYLLVAAFGTVVYDAEVTVLHRVHGRNATITNLWRHLPRRVLAHLRLRPRRHLSAMAHEFLRLFGDRLDADKRAIVERLVEVRGATWRARVSYARSPVVFRQTAVDDAILRVLLALGRF